jgi:hypothetical protein
MRELALVLLGIALAGSFIMASSGPSNAAFVYAPMTAARGAEVEKVNYRSPWRGYGSYYRGCYNCGPYWGVRRYYRPYYRSYVHPYFNPYRRYSPYYYPYRRGGLSLYFSF